MIKISLNSPHKKKRIISLFLMGACIFVLSASSILSFVSYKRIKETGYYLKRARGIDFSVRFVFFNPFKGVMINGFKCRHSGKIVFESGRVDVGFDLTSLLHRKISIKSVEVYQSRLFLDRMAPLLAGQEGLPDEALTFFDTVHFKAPDISVNDALKLDLSGYFSHIKQKLFVIRGKVFLKHARIPSIAPIDLTHDSVFSQGFDYAIEMESQKGDFIVSRCELNNSSLTLSGAGRIKDYEKQPKLALSFSLNNIVLDSLSFLNNASLRSRGLADIGLSLFGPLDRPDLTLNGRLINTQFVFLDSVFLEKVNGSFFFSKNQLSSQGFCFFVNGIELNSQINCSFDGYPRIFFKLFTPVHADKGSDFLLSLDAAWLNRYLAGNIDIAFHYVSKQTFNELNLEIKNFSLGYKNRLSFNSDALNASLDSRPFDPHSGIKPFSRNLMLKDVVSQVDMGSDGVVLKDFQAVCYDGGLRGDIRLLPQNEALSVTAEASVRNVDLSKAFSGSSAENMSLLSGRLSGQLEFDSELTQMLKGDFFVIDGMIEKSPILDAVADFLGVPSLKKVAFDRLIISLCGGKGDYTSKVRLISPKVNAILDGKITTYDKVDGYLSVSIVTELLNESKQFKKILAYIKHSESNVVFPFRISSYVDSPRVIWLKNEFKEKLQNLLPESNKRFLQEQLNSAIEKMAEE